MAKSFSKASLVLDCEPTDAALATLLGDANHPGRIVLKDSPDSLIGSPELIPVKFCVPWILLTAFTITLLPWLAPLWGGTFTGTVAQSMIAMIWCAIVPAMLALIFGSNHYFRSRGDYFVLDKVHRTLKLCQLDRTVSAVEISSIVELSRSYAAAGWDRVWTRQVSVVVHSSAGKHEVLPVARENVVRLFGPSLSIRLASVLGVPIRRISLDAAESSMRRD